MKIARRISFVAMLLSGAALIMEYILPWIISGFSRHPAKAASVGIIGGADGPTAIYVAAKSSPLLAPVVFALALVAWLSLRLYARKNEGGGQK